MGNEMKDLKKTVGINETKKAVEDGRAYKAFVANDADLSVTGPFEELCREKGVPVEYFETCAELGKFCGISVGSAVAALLR